MKSLVQRFNPLWMLVFCVCLVPLGMIIGQIAQNQLGPDPQKEVVLLLGIWTIRFLVLALVMTPAAEIFKQRKFIKYRRMIGLYTWFYALLHMLAFSVFLMNWNDALAELTKRPYIVVGLLAFIILTAMAVTSNRYMMRKLARKWKPLHRWVYVAAVLVCLHFIWLSRSDLGEAFLYTALFAVLLGYRAYGWLQKRQLQRQKQAVHS